MKREELDKTLMLISDLKQPLVSIIYAKICQRGKE